MAESNNGGPAFPRMTQKYNDTVEIAAHGMSLRDYFAGQALAGICSKTGNVEGRDDVGYRVRDAYELADAMLAERSK